MCFERKRNDYGRGNRGHVHWSAPTLLPMLVYQQPPAIAINEAMHKDGTTKMAAAARSKTTDTYILHHVFLLLFMMFLCIIMLFGVILMPFLS